MIIAVLCLVLNNSSSQRGTLTWSEASHSVRFLQGRVEFSFSSQVPSEVQNRYTCPCSTARNKRGHRVSWSRACMLGGKAATFPPHQQLSQLERTQQHGCRSASPASCPSALLLPGLRATASSTVFTGKRTCERCACSFYSEIMQTTEQRNLRTSTLIQSPQNAAI